MKFRRILPLFLSVWLFTAATAFAENMQFVDAVGATGYYVDVDSLSFSQTTEVQPDKTKKNYEIVQARVAVIKARTNRRYIYLMQFNKEKMLYRILSSKVQIYDSKQFVEQTDEVSPELPFVASSPMQTVLDFIYEQPRNK
ncbi:MAG: hypothetical protein E7201_11385 [Selenomonas ruminantium]|jgi:hypothetical protein|uniref:DUF4468 domain-containing protein n=1 Tax=Selenomonas ruminantium TaxID=971 RepID=A0A927WKS8_SELRU|nr:hypothetical protein [Selenomonas ruminantium]